MQIPKTMVVERIRSMSGSDAAERADAELPEKVDPVADSDLLRRLGLDPEQLAEEHHDQSPEVG